MRRNQQALARIAVIKALQMRKTAGYSLWDPICVYDLADRLGIEVRFVDLPSMEGIYSSAAHPTILISSLRPPGRQAYTCGHELGHHALGHGVQFDELIGDRSAARRFDPKEFQADCFAGALLMPQVAVKRGFALRGWEPASCTPQAVYVIATWLGVGYATLIQHMWKTLSMLSQGQAEELHRHTPRVLRAALLGHACREHLVVADAHWGSRAIDLQVPDLLLLPPDVCLEGRCVELLDQDGTRTLARAVTPGLGRVAAKGSDWAAYIRVSRQHYVGRAKYRFEEEVDDAW